MGIAGREGLSAGCLFSGEDACMRLCRVCANPDPRCAEWLRARLFAPKRRLRTTGRPCSLLNFTASRVVSGWVCPHANQRHRSIVVLPLTVGVHSIWSCRGSSDSHLSQRARLIICRPSPSKFTAFRVVAERAVHTRIGRPCSSACRHSPSKFTGFRVVAERVVHTRIGTLVRARAATHHRNSQCFESSWGGLSTPESTPLFERVPSLTIEIHSVLSCRGSRCPHPNRHPRSSACRRSPSKFTAF